MDKLEKIKDALLRFRDDRDWLQFHSPKNLAMAISGEAGELIEHFQWLTEEQSLSLDSVSKKKVAEEMADIQLYLILMSDRLNIDLLAESESKIEKNSQKYPVEKSRGNSKKYTDL
jgi:dCTP diphosphatase